MLIVPQMIELTIDYLDATVSSNMMKIVAVKIVVMLMVESLVIPDVDGAMYDVCVCICDTVFLMNMKDPNVPCGNN